MDEEQTKDTMPKKEEEGVTEDGGAVAAAAATTIEPEEEIKPETEEEHNEKQQNPNKKRKIALFLSYVGAGYQGMQRNPGVKTIEEDLFTAIHKAGGISEANADDRGFTKIHWNRAARTDKGVSAVGQVCSLNMILHPPDIIDRINAELPPAIKVYGYRRTVKGFDARKWCDKRRYEYILPAWMFDSNVQGVAAASKGAVEDAGDSIRGSGSAYGGGGDTEPQPQQHLPPSSFIFDEACVAKLNKILSQFHGTHNFHNYTIRMDRNIAQAKRYIISFAVSADDGVVNINGSPWVRLVVIGQSFVLHQIRKMVGMALAEYRGVAPPGCLKYALSAAHTVPTPMAPDLGLFLDECYYDAYNKRWGDHQESLNLSDWQEEVWKFKYERLYPALAQRDAEEGVNLSWLGTLNERSFKFSTWLLKKDAKGAAKMVKGHASGGGSGSGEEKGEDGGVNSSAITAATATAVMNTNADKKRKETTGNDTKTGEEEQQQQKKQNILLNVASLAAEYSD